MTAVVDFAALGTAIRRRRDETGRTRTLVAQLAGLDDGHHLHRIEQGVQTVSGDSLRLIAAALDTTPALLQQRAYTDTYGGDAA